MDSAPRFPSVLIVAVGVVPVVLLARRVDPCGLSSRTRCRGFDGRPALDGISFALEKGEIGCLLGPSGCGKTTALRCIAGLETLDAGRISRGRLLAGPGVHLAPHERGIGLVFQDHALFPHLTALGNVEFGLHAAGRGRAPRAGRGHARARGPRRQQAPYPAQLSGGQQQRVALARALAPGRPRCCSTSRSRASMSRCASGWSVNCARC